MILDTILSCVKNVLWHNLFFFPPDSYECIIAPLIEQQLTTYLFFPRSYLDIFLFPLLLLLYLLFYFYSLQLHAKCFLVFLLLNTSATYLFNKSVVRLELHIEFCDRKKSWARSKSHVNWNESDATTKIEAESEIEEIDVTAKKK